MRKVTLCIFILLPLLAMAQVMILPFPTDKNANNCTRYGQRGWRIDNLIEEGWNDTEFIANQKTVIVYEETSEGAPQQINNFYWSVDHWAQNANYNYIYDDNSGLIQHADHNYINGATSSPNYKYDYTYDDAHHLTGISMFQYRTTEDEWLAYKRMHFIYAGGFLTSTVEWRNNFGNNGYDRYDYTYGTDNKVSTQTRLYCTDSLSWATTGQLQYTYHANDYTTNNGFLNYYAHSYPITYPLQQSDIPGYSSYGMPLQISDYYWIGAQWLLMSRSTYTYSATNKPTEFLSEVYSGGWINDQRWTMTYDANDNPEYQTYQEWNGSSWSNQYRLAYNWTQYTENDDETMIPISELGLDIYPNPCVDNFKVITSTKQIQPVRIKVFNAKGQCLQSFDTNPNQSFNIDSSKMANGIYYLKATQGALAQTKKMVRIKK